MSSRRDFLKVLGAALGVAVVPPALARAAELCRTDGDVADLIDKALDRREAYALNTITLYAADEPMAWQWAFLDTGPTTVLVAEPLRPHPIVVKYRGVIRHGVVG